MTSVPVSLDAPTYEWPPERPVIVRPWSRAKVMQVEMSCRERIRASAAGRRESHLGSKSGTRLSYRVDPGSDALPARTRSRSAQSPGLGPVTVGAAKALLAAARGSAAPG